MFQQLRYVAADANLQIAIDEIITAGGRILHTFGSQAFVANVLEPTIFRYSRLQSYGNLSDGTQLMVNAWLANQNHQPTVSPTEGLPWNTAGYQAPK